MASLQPAYQPQQDLLEKQKGGLDAEYQPQYAALDTAKTNAFHGIVDDSAKRGVAYSGVTPEAENRYVGEHYLPARANLATSQTNRRNSLDQAIAGLKSDQYKQAYGTYQQQMAQDQAIAEQRRAQAAQQASQARYSGGGGRSQGGSAPSFNVTRDAVGGYAVRGPNGQAATLAQYAAANGGGYQDVLGLLAQGSRGDRQLAAQLSKSNLSPQQLQSQHPEIFGGV